MIDCPDGDIRDLLPDLVHDRLGAAERARVEAHVATCGPCRDELALLRDLRATMRRVPAIDASVVAAAISSYRAPVRRSWSSWRAAAVIATIAIGGTSIAIVHRQPTAVVSEPIAELPAAVSTQPTPSVPGVEAPKPVDSADIAPAPASVTTRTDGAPAVEATRELAMGGGTVGELSDHELKTLLDDIESLDALPSAEVEAAPVTPIPPTAGVR